MTRSWAQKWARKHQQSLSVSSETGPTLSGFIAPPQAAQSVWQELSPQHKSTVTRRLRRPGNKPAAECVHCVAKPSGLMGDVRYTVSLQRHESVHSFLISAHLNVSDHQVNFNIVFYLSGTGPTCPVSNCVYGTQTFKKPQKSLGSSRCFFAKCEISWLNWFII